MSDEQTTEPQNLVKQGSILSVLTLVSRVLGLMREMVKAALLGTTPLSDAFTVAFMVPNLFRRLFAEGSISVAFIPTFKGYLIEGDTAKTQTFLSSFITALTVLVTTVVTLGIIAAPWIIPFFGLTELDETILLTRIMFPYLALISFAALLQGILNSHHIFIPTGLAPILLNITVIGCSYLLTPLMANPARAMAVGVMIGGTLQVLIQVPGVLRKGHRFGYTGLKQAFTNPGTRTVFRLVGPTIIGMAAYQLNDLVSTALAGNAGPGVVSSLQYSLRLQELILGVFAVSLGTVLLPDLAGQAKRNQWGEFNRRLVMAIDIIALITIPITFFSLIQGEYIIRLLFQSRSFDESSVALTKEAFTFHMLGLFFIALNRILAPAFYAQSNSKSPTIAGVFSFFINMILAALLVGPMKGGGVALALSIASGVNTALLFIFMRRTPQIDMRHIIGSSVRYTGKLLAFSALASIPVYVVSPALYRLFAGRGRLISYGIPLTLSTILFGVVGLILLWISGDALLKMVTQRLSQRLGKHGTSQ
ncbi:MAG: murein biosynthesis integral membrane protein MurJ [Breznakiellaceae bacterium]